MWSCWPTARLKVNDLRGRFLPNGFHSFGLSCPKADRCRVIQRGACPTIRVPGLPGLRNFFANPGGSGELFGFHHITPGSVHYRPRHPADREIFALLASSLERLPEKLIAIV